MIDIDMKLVRKFKFMPIEAFHILENLFLCGKCPIIPHTTVGKHLKTNKQTNTRKQKPTKQNKTKQNHVLQFINFSNILFVCIISGSVDCGPPPP